jgi:hypothetical protein
MPKTKNQTSTDVEELPAQEHPVVIYVSGPELAMRLHRSFPTILNWWSQGRIIESAFLDVQKKNTIMFTQEAAEAIIEEAKSKKDGRPDIKREPQEG